MKSKLIGLILNTLLKEYNSGACDNLSKEQESELFDELTEMYAKITNKVDKSYTTEEASLYLNITRLTINNYVKLGKLTPIKLKGGVLLFNKKELDNLKFNNKNK